MTRRGCSVAGCDQPHLARTYCKRHYRRWHAHGDPLGGRSLIEAHALVTETDKPCTWCGVRKPLEEFAADNRSYGGRLPHCRECWRNYMRERGAQPEVAERARALSRAAYMDPHRRAMLRVALVRRKYGERAVDAERRRVDGSGACETCGGRERLVLDHNHATPGTFRGLLCARCNRTLGAVCDDPKLLRALAEYLER